MLQSGHNERDGTSALLFLADWLFLQRLITLAEATSFEGRHLVNVRNGMSDRMRT